MFDGRGRNITRLGILVSFVLGLLFSMTSYWYLVLAAGIASGSFFREPRRGTVISFIGVTLAWMVSILGRPSDLLLEKVTGVLPLVAPSGAISIIVVILAGGLLGGLGGAIGSGLKRLRRDKRTTDKGR